MSEVSVVLPTLNEAGNISLLFERLVKALGNGFEAVLVDDGSTDGTVEEARHLGYRIKENWKISEFWVFSQKIN